MEYINNPFAFNRIIIWLWKKLLCPHGVHLFDEVLTDTPQSEFICDGCGFQIPRDGSIGSDGGSSRLFMSKQL